MSQNSSTEIFLTPCSKQGGNSRAYRHLQDTVVDGVDLDSTKRPSGSRSKKKVSIWGVTAGNKHLWERLEPRNYLLFYVGDYKYEYVAEVIATREDPELAEQLWPDHRPGETGGNDPGDPWNYIIFLESPIRVDIDSEEIHGFADHKSNYPQRFMPLNDLAHQTINSRFGSLEKYFEARIPAPEDESFSEGRSPSEESSDTSTGSVDREERVSDLRPPERTKTTVSRIIRNTALAKELKERYNYTCQVCGEYRQRTSSDRYAEAHHIKPLGGSDPGPDAEENILVLCPNHHSDFDYGMLEVDPDSLTISHAYDDRVDGTELQVQEEHNLSRSYLNYHNSEISRVK